ncbi:hypothetical protein IAI10_14235 [Clostridium sp. 19966]|uniref:hypothetical protein n=1 Tax=Clostridium sp. 19966 TaxID=2768166 RepID=UPI0028DD61B3|nr:hypothetical protein [Clostridium sp. 19966]MDT8717823.1 hypothetical protein [Clostridium sp. 19966]
MSKILDLSLFQEETLNITTPKGEVIHVKKPTEELAIKLISYQYKAQEIEKKEQYEKEDLNQLMEFLRTLAKDILSHNKDGISVDDNYLKENEIHYGMWVAILEAYTEFMSEVTSDPNSKSPQSRSKRK